MKLPEKPEKSEESEEKNLLTNKQALSGYRKRFRAVGAVMPNKQRLNI